MISVLILFGPPVDRTAFDTYFSESHRPLLGRLPHVERVTIHRVVAAETGKPPWVTMVDLRFQSEEAMQQGLNSEEGQAMAGDFPAFASGGVTILFSQSAEMS